ncbi:DUF551 domain-containing protein [Klebsiella variicola]|nr:DUF551 domain-containing protein [Klebsiella variicola]MCW9273782.1 DUF551 domain-containing protein [Klebsiella variicola]
MTSKLTREKAQWLHDACEEAAAAGIKLTMNPNELLMFTSYALAAMDSDPVAEVVSIYGDPEAFGEREIRPLVGIQQMPYGTKLYRHAQPVLEYPETLPCPVLLEPGLRFGKGIKTSTMLAALARRSVYESDMAALSPEERAEFQMGIEDFKALIAQPAPVENHIGSKNALDAIVSFIKSKSNPTVKCYEEVSEQLFKDNCHGIHSHVIEYILKLGEELEDLRAEQDEIQSAPVVPEEMTIRDACKFVQDMRLFDDVSVIVMRAWNACRAAMLAAAPQSPGIEPATVPGKWIPVSERMPESNGVYFGWDGKRVLEVNCFFGGFSANQFIHGEITHWMPLPATPQEVK